MKIVAFGECMIELQGSMGGEARLAFGGDTLNTAVYLARLGSQVRYATALGKDAYSAAMLAAWREERVETDLVLTDPDRLPGLYAIHTDAQGERTFSYWRQHSAARNFFNLPGAEGALAEMAAADLLYFSGITLSIFQPAERARLAEIAQAVRDRGGDVAFDPSYRPRGWSGPDEARAAFEAIAPTVTLAMPTYEDEQALHGDETPEETARRWRAAGVREAIVKRGPDGALCVWDGGEAMVPTPHRVAAVDTTGAGDSFNAGYLHARGRGAAPEAAAAFAHRLAGEVVRHRGAVIPREATPAYAG